MSNKMNIEGVVFQSKQSAVGKHEVLFSLNANSLKRASSFVGLMHSFTDMVHNEDTAWNIDQILCSQDLMSIFLDLILRDFLNYIIK